MTPVDVRTDGDVVVAVMPSELDLGNAQLVGDHVLASIPNEAAGLVVDLAGVDYLDSTGIRMLLQFARRTSACRQRMALLVPEDSRLRRLLEMAKIQDAVPIHPSLDAATAWVDPAAH